MIKVLFLTQTPQSGASARYRVYQFLESLRGSGIDCVVSPAVSESLLKDYLGSKNIITKFHFYGSQILKRITEVAKIKDFDIVFLQRDIVVHFYPFLEKMISGVNKNIIFDFDDAIHLLPPDKKTNFFFNLMWDRGKIEKIIRLSKQVIAGNNFLREYAEKFSKNVTVIPTSIDLKLYNSDQKPRRFSEKIIIGWIGSEFTFTYLERIFPVFIELAKKYKIELKVIGARRPLMEGLEISYKDWDLKSEIAEIYSFDIGVMPLADDAWSRGKSGTKLLQYMAAGVPAVASPVGINKEIIHDEENGFLAHTPLEWVRKISCLIENKILAERMRIEARKTVERDYSTEVNAPKLLKVIKDVLS